MKDLTTVYYRQCFSTESGRLVLANILVEAGLFRPLHSQEDMTKMNFAKTILAKTGGFGEKNVSFLVQSIIDSPII